MRSAFGHVASSADEIRCLSNDYPYSPCNRVSRLWRDATHSEFFFQQTLSLGHQIKTELAVAASLNDFVFDQLINHPCGGKIPEPISMPK